MPTITADYENHTKDELLAEVRERGLSGVNSASSKSDIISVLVADDGAGSFPSGAPKPAPSPLPVGKPNAPTFAAVSEAPADAEYIDGIFVKDGEQYAVCIRENVPNGRTHFAKNTERFWNGTLEEFRAQFEKA